MSWKGCRYTWTNKQEFGSCGFFKLDTVLMNPCQNTALPDAESVFLVDDASDLVPCLIKCFEKPSLGVSSFQVL